MVARAAKQLDEQDIVSLELNLNCEICAEQQFSTARCNGLLGAVLPFPSPYLTLCRTPTKAYHPVVPVKAVSIVPADILLEMQLCETAALYIQILPRFGAHNASVQRYGVRYCQHSNVNSYLAVESFSTQISHVCLCSFQFDLALTELLLQLCCMWPQLCQFGLQLLVSSLCSANARLQGCMTLCSALWAD